MHDLFLSQTHVKRAGVTTVTDDNNTVKYYISGQIGKRHNQLTIFNQSYEPLAVIMQISGNLLPRFTLTSENKQVGSIGLSLRRHELLFVNSLNWVVLGSLEKRRFQITKVNKQLAAATPLADHRLHVQIINDQSEELLVLIMAFLDRWAFISQGHPLSWPSIFNNPNPVLAPFTNKSN